VTPVAYGPLALKPWEFEALTPGEVLQLHAGYQWRLTHPAPEAVWLATVIVNLFGPDLPWTPETMLGRRPDGLANNG